ncbi:MAG: DNA mismatch repair endonuclease MutL [Nitrospira sp.]|nr:DNA mismatch repair endonuclease MutL [Nitrospira sp.]
MPQIKILPPHVRNKIAAGEVVERPASVVKELIENSIDAVSTDISVEVRYGGKRFIRVSDNGGGMDREDALLCFRRHATSKLSHEEDLFNIKTMGFRGEALSSIASVSKMKLITAPMGTSRGVLIELQGGEMSEIRDSPSAGTTIQVEDLFFNLPARKKFLKSNRTELLHIIDKVTEEALAHYEIGFTFTSDNYGTMHLPDASSFRERIMQIYGEEFLEGLTEAHAESEDIRIRFFISKTDNFRNTKTHQFIAINRRPIRDPSISHAVYGAYEGILPENKHPMFFLFIEMDPRRVDFNVHPTKREVRFEDKESVYRFIRNSIRDFIAHPPRPVSYESPSASVVSESLELSYQPSPSFLYLGESFVAISEKKGLTLIDQHAAHERVLYEKLLKGVDLASHALLFPRQVKLSHKEYMIILEHRSVLRDFGIEVDDFGHNTLVIRTLPDALKEADIRDMLSDIASCLLEGTTPLSNLRENIAAKMACHKSVRGKMTLTQEDLTKLLSELERCINPDRCPHGRPIRIFFSLEHLNKIFKRK